MGRDVIWLGRPSRIPGGVGSPAGAGVEECRDRTWVVGDVDGSTLSDDFDPPGEFVGEFGAIAAEFRNRHVVPAGVLCLPLGQQVAEAGFVGHG
jgi:hypothetical protein